jgi:hypothetical protein
VKQIFVSRLVGAGASAHFEIVNGGAPISTGPNDSLRPDITFSGNTPYVTWREDIGGGVEKAFTGHFVNPASPTFVLDSNEVPLTPTAQADVREPISSSCIATPFNSDGAACQGGAIGTPFFLYTNGTSPRGLFANAYQAANPVTGAASAVGISTASVTGTVNPLGAAVRVAFEYGTTTAYGQTTVAQSSGVSNESRPFSAELASLPAGTTIHYRAIAVSDLGKLVGADRTLTTSSPPPPPQPAPGAGQAHASAAGLRIAGTSATVRVACTGAPDSSCRIVLRLTVVERFKGGKLVGLSASTKGKRKLVVVGAASATLAAGQSTVLRVALNRTGKRLLAHRRSLKAHLQITQVSAGGDSATLLARTVVFGHARKHR